MKWSLHQFLHTQDKLADLREAFDSYLKETYPNITISQQSRHWSRFITYLKKSRKEK